MKFPIPFLPWTGRPAFEVEIPNDTDPYRRLKVALEIAVRSGARLDGARLDNASLIGASLDGAPIMLGYPNGWAAWAYPAQPDKALRISVGCRSGWTLAQGRDYWRGKDYRREVMAALDYAEAVAKLRGWTVEG